jgi:hypothetical protein
MKGFIIGINLIAGIWNGVSYFERRNLLSGIVAIGNFIVVIFYILIILT